MTDIIEFFGSRVRFRRQVRGEIVKYGLTEKEKLIRYNAEDCEALEIVTQKMLSLQKPQVVGEVTKSGFN
jgi:hypothetical protein